MIARQYPKSMVPVAIILISVMSAAPAVARHSDEARVGLCIRQASAGRTWLEKTLWGLFDQEGGWVGAQIANANGTHDLGPLQVNSWWVSRIAELTAREPPLVRHWLINDVCFNVRAARWIFLGALTRTQNYWKAVGAYHSPSKARQIAYAIKVAGRMRVRFGEDLFDRDASAPTDLP